MRSVATPRFLRHGWLSALAVIALSTAGARPAPAPAPEPAPGTWEELVTLFHEWRAFERPAFVDGVPDYTAAAMAAPAAPCSRASQAVSASCTAPGASISTARNPVRRVS